MKPLLSMLVLALLVLVSPASAQTVTNPNAVQFQASPDHTTLINGAPVLTSYQLDVVAATATAALAFTVSLGKPSPTDPTSTLIVSGVIPQLTTLSSGMYTATVTAIGPGGSGKSAPTVPFARIGPARAPTAVTPVTR